LNTKTNNLFVNIYFDNSLFLEKENLNVIFDIVRKIAPDWAIKIQSDRGELDSQEFYNWVTSIALVRGEHYNQLVSQHGKGEYERNSGTIGITGATSDFELIISLDEYSFSPSAGRYLIGNSISFHLESERISGLSSSVFIKKIIQEICKKLNPMYGNAYIYEERDSKNMNREGSVMAIGVDISRYLPGLYWLNFFGDKYVNLIGKSKLVEAPAERVEVFDSGILIETHKDPKRWAQESQKNNSLLEYIGKKYFFDKAGLNRETIAPDFNLKPLVRNKRFS